MAYHILKAPTTRRGGGQRSEQSTLGRGKPHLGRRLIAAEAVPALGPCCRDSA